MLTLFQIGESTVPNKDADNGRISLHAGASCCLCAEVVDRLREELQATQDILTGIRKRYP
jgi:hypothetical protein